MDGFKYDPIYSYEVMISHLIKKQFFYLSKTLIGLICDPYFRQFLH